MQKLTQAIDVISSLTDENLDELVKAHKKEHKVSGDDIDVLIHFFEYHIGAAQSKIDYDKLLEETMVSKIEKSHNMLVSKAGRHKGETIPKELAKIKQDSEAALIKTQEKLYKGSTEVGSKANKAAMSANVSSYEYQDIIETRPKSGLFASRSSSYKNYVEQFEQMVVYKLERMNALVASAQGQLEDFLTTQESLYKKYGELKDVLQQGISLNIRADLQTATKNLHELLGTGPLRDIIQNESAQTAAQVLNQPLQGHASSLMDGIMLLAKDKPEIEMKLVLDVMIPLLGRDITIKLFDDLSKTIMQRYETRSKDVRLLQTAKRYQDYIQVIESDEIYSATDVQDYESLEAPIKNYIFMMGRFGLAKTRQPSDMLNFIEGDGFKILPQTVKESILKEGKAQYSDYLAYLLTEAKQDKNILGRGTKYHQDVIRDAVILEDFIAAAGTAFTSGLLADFIASKPGRMQEIQLEKMQTLISNYQDKDLSNYAGLNFYATHAVKSNDGSSLLVALDKGLVAAVPEAMRLDVLTSQVDFKDENSKPIYALYKAASKSDEILASTMITLDNAFNESEFDTIVSYMKTAAEWQGSEALSKLEGYLSVYQSHGADILSNLVKVQNDAAKLFADGELNNIEKFAASDALKELPEDVQALVLDQKLVTELLAGMVKVSDGDVKSQAQAFVIINQAVKDEAVIDNAFKALSVATKADAQLSGAMADYAALARDEDSARLIKSYAEMRMRYQGALENKDGAALLSLFKDISQASKTDLMLERLLNDENLKGAFNILLDADQSANAQLNALKSFKIICADDALINGVIAGRNNAAEFHRLSLYQEAYENGVDDINAILSSYAALEENILGAYAQSDIPAIRNILLSDEAQTLSSGFKAKLINTPVANNTVLLDAIVEYKHDDLDEMAVSIKAIGSYMNETHLAELLLKQDSDSGLTLFEAQMQGKSAYEQAQVAISFGDMLHDNYETVLHNVLQKYADTIEDESDKNRFKVIANYVMFTLATLNVDEQEASPAEVASKAMADLNGVFEALEEVDENRDLKSFDEFLASYSFAELQGNQEFATKAKILLSYPSLEGNILDIVYDGINGDVDQEISFFSVLQTALNEESDNVSVYNYLLQKYEEGSDEYNRVASYVSAISNEDFNDLVNLRAAQKQFDALLENKDQPNLKDYRALLTDDAFTSLSEGKRLNFMRFAMSESQEDAKSVAVQVIKLGLKSPNKMSEAIQLLGGALEDTGMKASLFDDVAEILAEGAEKQQYAEYVKLYNTGEIEALDSLAKVQTTIKKAAKKSDTQALRAMVGDQDLSNLGYERRSQILSAPIIGDKTLLTLLIEEAAGDLDKEADVFFELSKSVDDSELFASIVGETIENTANDAARTRLAKYNELLSEGNAEQAQDSVGAFKALDAAFAELDTLSLSRLLTNEGFEGLDKDQAYEFLKTPAKDGQSVFAVALNNIGDNKVELAETIQVLQDYFDEGSYAQSLYESYNSSEDDDFDAQHSANFELLKQAAEEHGVDITVSVGKVLMAIDAGVEKGSQIALSNVLRSSDFTDLPDEYKSYFTGQSSKAPNIYKAMLKIASGDALQEAELVADIVGANIGGDSAYKVIGDLIQKSEDDEQIARLKSYRQAMFNNLVMARSGYYRDIDVLVDISNVTRVESGRSLLVYGHDEDGQRSIDYDPDFIEAMAESGRFAGVVDCDNMPIYAKDQISTVAYNGSMEEIEFHHNNSTPEDSMISTLSCEKGQAFDIIKDLCADWGFVRTPDDSLRAIHVDRINAINYNAKKGVLFIKTVTGDHSFKKVSDDVAQKFIDNAKAHKTFIRAEGSDEYMALDHIRRVRYDAKKSQLILEHSKKDRLVLDRDEGHARQVMDMFVNEHNFIDRGETPRALSNINRVTSIEYSLASMVLSVNLVDGGCCRTEVYLDDIAPYFEQYAENSQLTKQSDCRFDKTSNTKEPFIDPKGALSADFNAEAAVERMLEKQQKSTSDIQLAINAATLWLDTHYSVECESVDNERVKALGALLVSAYGNGYAPIPEKAQQASKAAIHEQGEDNGSKSKSPLGNAFNDFANAWADDEEAPSQPESSVVSIANDNLVMRPYQKALNKLANS